MQKRIKAIGRDAMVLTGTGIGLGVGASVLTGVGAGTGAVTAISGKLPAVGGIMVAGHVMGMVSDINKPLKKQRRY